MKLTREEMKVKAKAFWNGFSHPFLYMESADYDENNDVVTYAGALTRAVVSGSIIGCAVAGCDWKKAYDQGRVAVCQTNGVWKAKHFKVAPESWGIYALKEKKK